jgi:hypothetical protein
MRMLMGNNVDIDRRGKTVHIQTEDLGRNASRIMTQVFHSGAIVDSKTVSYAEELEKYDGEEKQNEILRKMMLALGRHFMKQIHAGVYDTKLGLPPMTEAEIIAAERPPTVPGAKTVKDVPAATSKPPLPSREVDEAELSGAFGNTTGMGLGHQAAEGSRRAPNVSDAWVAVAVSGFSSSPAPSYRGVPDFAKLDAATTADIRALFEEG